MNRLAIPTTLCAALILCALCDPCVAQSPPWANMPNWISEDDKFTMSVALADLDRDGYLDLVAGNYRYPYTFEVQQAGQLQSGDIGDYLLGYHGTAQDQGALNDGPNPFTLIPRCIDCIAIADYDADRDLDIAVGAVVGKGNDGGVWVFKNQGGGWYTMFSDDGLPEHVWHPTESYDAHCVRWVDYNLDGWLDLAVLEVGGLLKLYENGDRSDSVGLQLELSEYPVTIDFSALIFDNMNGSEENLDELSRTPASLQLVNMGTTMEFGDMNGNGDPDLFINVGGMPVVFEHQDQAPFYDPDIYWKIRDADWSQYRRKHESMACASFGFYDTGSEIELALAIGSMVFAGSDESENFDGWRNDIYALSPDQTHLDHVWQSWEPMFIMPVAPQTQLVTDIQWARIQGEDDMDLVTASYPCSKKIGENSYAWDRGLEFFYGDPSNTNTIRDWQSAEADLSTSLALGDVGNHFDRQYPSSAKIIEIRSEDDIRALNYLEDFPVYEICDIYHKAPGSGTWDDELNRECWCADIVNGWISISEATQQDLWTHYQGAFDLRIRYWENTNFDLAIGNDGKNVVYFYGETSGENYEAEPEPELTTINPSPIHQYNPADYDIDPEADEIDLMAKDAVGANFSIWNGQYGTDADAIGDFLGGHPKIQTTLLSNGWSLEYIRGHYFWDRLDKNINAVKDYDVLLFTTGSPFWVLGNRQPPQVPLVDPQYDDLHARPSDERLQAMFVRNLVNRYRPYGFVSQQDGFSWGNWGVQMFQFENEPPAPLEGYGAWGDVPEASDSCIIDLAARLYWQYQMVKEVQATDGQNVLLSVVSPNWGQHNPNSFRLDGGPEQHVYSNDDDLYNTPPIPYFNALNQVDLPLPVSDGPDSVFWRFTDYISQQMYNSRGGLPYQDPFAQMETGDPPLKLGIEHNYWGYYTVGLADYVGADGFEADWKPPMMRQGGSYSEHPFIAVEWNYYYNTTEDFPNDYYAAHLAELFSVDVFPTAAKNHRLLTHDLSWQATGGEPIYLTELKPIFETVTELLNDPDDPGVGMKFFEQVDSLIEDSPNADVAVHRYSFNKRGSTNLCDMAHFIRTDDSPPGVEDRYVKCDFDLTLFDDMTLTYPCTQCHEGDPRDDFDVSLIKATTPNGNYFDKDGQVAVGGYGWTGNLVQVEFQAGEMGPSMIIMKLDDEWPIVDYDQTIQLHEKWNLVSWHIEPLPQPFQFQQILPNPSWFTDAGGQLYTWYDNDFYWPPYHETEVWNLNYAYYIKLNESCTWGYTNKPRFDLNQVTGILPSDAWAHDEIVGYPNISYWFFLGYAAPGYCKLADVVIQETGVAPNGDPANFSFEGPLHWLVWQNDEPNNYPPYDLKIVKTDDGKIYLPYAGVQRRPIDEIGVLEPGRGYFLGFSDDGPYTFDGWNGWPQWQNENYIPPQPPGSGRGVASSAHFQYQPYTHWSYPIVIDTVDLGTTPLTAGDEIAVFDGERCVGAKSYTGEFPVVLIAWEDDIATPMDVDGYGFGNPMTFLWYDASENAEIEFELPPETQALPNDPVTPSNGGFGLGLYARRSLMEGPSTVTQLPQEYKMRQNFPNPFNAETVIPLELPQRSNVKLEIFNVKGQRLGLPFEHIYDAGWPKIRWNAGKLPSGIYFYRITAEGLERAGHFSAVGKLILLK